MRYQNGFTKSMGILLLVVSMVIIPKISGFALTSHSQSEGSHENISQSMNMDDETHETNKPEAEKKDMAGTTEDGHDQMKTEEESGHGESDQGVNWPVIWSFAGINGSALITAALLRRKKLTSMEESK